jgi:hypothetical protein
MICATSFGFNLADTRLQDGFNSMMNTDRWFYLAVAALVTFAYVSTQCRDRYEATSSDEVLDRWTGKRHGVAGNGWYTTQFNQAPDFVEITPAKK